MEKRKEYQTIITNLEKTSYINKNKFKKLKNIFKNFSLKYCTFVIIIAIVLFLIFWFLFKKHANKDNKLKVINNERKPNKSYPITNILNTPLDTYDLSILEPIENKIKNYIELTVDEMRYFNGVLRKVKPKKVVEIGVSKGGSAVLILNAIKDIKDAKLYSIDKNKICYRNKGKKSGFLVEEKFPELMKNWKLFLDGVTAEFIESIGDGIDLAFIDTMHITPGEMLDFLMILPFLKNEAIVVFHDAFILYYGRKITRFKTHTSNNQLMTYVRGDLILPSYGDKVFFRNIGSLKLSPDQEKYYYQYFLALGIQWEYMPEEKDLKIMREFFMKYYGEKYVEVYDDAVEKNKIYLNKY